MSSDQHQAVLSRARDYPYDYPEHSFVYRDDGIGPFDAELTRARTPVLAIGSNQSPIRLAQKFGHDASHVIPVQRARLHGFDVVYSAHITSYGAVPAMLQVAEGAAVSIGVTWLDDEQLDLMHASEVTAANYAFATLEGLDLALDDGRRETRAHAYVSARGHLAHDAAPIALRRVRCERRRYPEMDTAEVLEVVRRRLASPLEPDDFVHRLVDDVGYRREVSQTLGHDAVAFAWPFRCAT